MNEHQHVSWKTFLKDVLICSLGAYGGPEAHYGVFTDQMITKKHYLTEEELTELIALTAIVPGPSSTQTIVAIGYKVGGPWLALLTMIVWALPVVILMTALSFMYQILERFNVGSEGLRLIAPMAVGFIFIAAFRIGKKVVKDLLTLLIFLVAGITTYFFRFAWVFPLLLFLGGLTYVFLSKEKDLWHKITIKPPYRYLIAFFVLLVLSLVLLFAVNHPTIFLFERFFQYGYLIIGGGQVVVPYMFTDLVETYGFMTSQEFLTGFGLVQGLPGPMFSFSAYAGGMATRSLSPFLQAFTGILSAIAIFTPGILLIYFIYPIWIQLKTIKGIRVAIKGITVVAAGLIASAGVVLLRESGFGLENVIVLILTSILLLTKKIPAPLIVLLVIVIGFIL
ncbi:MAG: chromate transporter [Tenericutes bacterium GWC2_34_14]|nr:MAG: chromate transporter [Tenericutes bacterium GWA2_35_7]OHE30020.1 MAG: chromate transporter [Tenericutes bacterium GWC2_34_14]OHE34999.1 MAG: chromate transporter [Tenericutes bacterium GWE2_34_108]OHE37141.1 MAG: chromate transporter [Tenericutes bacterium GWF1_35_14]OHE39727.1 MAG: chromate transporter [Tenericutes bacterium GWF2_35_184]OHE44085.1 MAG: chromate transporter [Tenericutes bacterium RIFOXYA2_FULL_36_32]OHE44665.1 MAG: chromate transporter [Tenericutes bacterium RIFOXYA12